MTLQECYAAMGGSYDEVLARLRKEERIQKFLLMVLKDPSYDLLVTSIEAKNVEEAFRAAHTIKGASANLALTRLQNSASVLADVLRNRHDFGDDILPPYQQLQKDYASTMDCIRQLQQSL